MGSHGIVHELSLGFTHSLQKQIEVKDIISSQAGSISSKFSFPYPIDVDVIVLDAGNGSQAVRRNDTPERSWNRGKIRFETRRDFVDFPQMPKPARDNDLKASGFFTFLGPVFLQENFGILRKFRVHKS